MKFCFEISLIEQAPAWYPNKFGNCLSTRTGKNEIRKLYEKSNPVIELSGGVEIVTFRWLIDVVVVIKQPFAVTIGPYKFIFWKLSHATSFASILSNVWIKKNRNKIWLKLRKLNFDTFADQIYKPFHSCHVAFFTRFNWRKLTDDSSFRSRKNQDWNDYCKFTERYRFL